MLHISFHLDIFESLIFGLYVLTEYSQLTLKVGVNMKLNEILRGLKRG